MSNKAEESLENLKNQLQTKENELEIERDRLKYLTNYFSQIMQAMPAGIIVTDEDCFITMSNKAVADIFGLEVSQIEGSPLQEFLNIESLEDEPDEESLRKLNGLQQEILVESARSSREIPLLVSLSLLAFENGEFEGILCILQDISERKQLEGQLVQSQKLESVGQLAAGIAHEINTPIQYVRDNSIFVKSEFENITSFIRLNQQLVSALKDSKPTDALLRQVDEQSEKIELEYLLDEIPEAMSQTFEGAESVAKIVRSMKDFSHPGGGEKTAVDLNEALDSTITVSTNEWKYFADVETNFDSSLRKVPGFPAELNQVFLNIVVNAAHAISEATSAGEQGKGKICISTSADNDWAEVRISDTGPGIPEEIRDKIFNPFFTTKQVGEGTGQGLTLAHSTIVDKHSGELRFESEVGTGTTFIVRLPLNE